MTQRETVRYDAALTAAMLILDELAPSPGGGKAQVLGTLTFIILEAIYASEHRLLASSMLSPSPN